MKLNAGRTMKASERGDVRAQSDLGWMYKFGRGVLRDDAKTFELHTEADEQTDEDAYEELNSLTEQ